MRATTIKLEKSFQEKKKRTFSRNRALGQCLQYLQWVTALWGPAGQMSSCSCIVMWQCDLRVLSTVIYTVTHTAHTGLQQTANSYICCISANKTSGVRICSGWQEQRHSVYIRNTEIVPHVSKRKQEVGVRKESKRGAEKPTRRIQVVWKERLRVKG